MKSNTEAYQTLQEIGANMISWAKELYPLNRSLTGLGVRSTLQYIKKSLNSLIVYEVDSGTKVYDWTIPNEWTIRNAYIEDESRTRIVDFSNHNLHLVGYSHPIDSWMSLEELNMHLHSLPDQPDAIPYVTSYYNDNWGFCIQHSKREELKQGNYHVVIDSDLSPGKLNYADLIIPGETDREILLSTYICHPSMANNELSGIVVTKALAIWISNLKKRKYTYRIVFVPETIGSIVYINKNLEKLKTSVVAGFNVTCVGDERCYSFLPSRNGNTLSDKVAKYVLKNTDIHYKKYSWLDRGSDERQYCAPGVDLPIVSIMRSKYGEYPEYHTSLDNFNVVTQAGLEGGFRVLQNAIEILESNIILKVTILCEPQLGKRGLYPNISNKNSGDRVKVMMNLISYCDGTLSLLEIANIIEESFWDLFSIANILINENILEIIDN
jgi:aminopeptidase-like protein